MTVCMTHKTLKWTQVSNYLVLSQRYSVQNCEDTYRKTRQILWIYIWQTEVDVLNTTQELLGIWIFLAQRSGVQEVLSNQYL